MSETETQLRKIIRELEQLNRELELRIDREVEKSRRQEHTMMQQTKLAAMGQMVNAIAHQWRQPLTTIGFILENIQAAFRMGKLDEAYLDKSVNDGMEQIQFMSRIIDNSRNFMLSSKEKTSFDIMKAISDTLALLDSQIKNSGVTVQFQGPQQEGDGIFIFGFPLEFKQVLVNMLNNGLLAIGRKMEKGGLEKNEGEIRIQVKQEDGEVILEISNNGFCIPQELQQRIFEPFYTSAEDGKVPVKGRGIGLYMSKIIIEQNMNGKIYCRNTQQGVMFIIRLKREETDG